MNELNKAELRRLAEAAMPGDWFKAGNLLCFDAKTGESHSLNVEDDRFIVSASPAAVLSLLDECDRLQATCEGLDRQNDAIAEEIGKVAAERDAALVELEACRKDADRLDRLDALCEAYGFQDIHEGNRWMIDGPFRTVRDAIDAMYQDQSK